MRHITRTKIFFLADGKTEALTVYERTHYQDPTDRTHDVVFPSRREEAATSSRLEEYSDAWKEASDWVAKRQQPLSLCPCGAVFAIGGFCYDCAQRL